MTSNLLQFSTGTFEFYEQLPVVLLPASNAESSASTYSIDNSKYSNALGAEKSDRIVRGNKVCLLMVPSFMIPCEILRYFTTTYLEKMLSIQILRHTGNNDDKYLAFLQLDSEESAKSFIQDFDGQPLSSLEQVSCILYSIKSVHASTVNCHDTVSEYQYGERNNNTGHTTFREMPSATDSAMPQSNHLIPSPTSSKLRSRALSLSSFPVAITAPDNLSAKPSKITDFSSLGNLPGIETAPLSSPKEAVSCPEEENFCPVCLEVIHSSSPHSFTTACQHTYHIDCISKLEGPQCPVCRFQHDSASEYLSACSECGWQGQGQGQGQGLSEWNPRFSTEDSSSSGPIVASNNSSGSGSGYDRSSEFSGATGLPTLDRNDLNRDCNNDSEYDSSSSSSNNAHSYSHDHSTAQAEASCDLWVCLLCGFIGCGSSHCNHIRQHYERHLHAYAMNTENRGVWDFAGDGWVHRLVLHQSDPVPAADTVGEWQSGTGASGSPSRVSAPHQNQASSSSSSSSSSSRGEVNVKIVEIADPRSHATHRPRTAPLSEQQEEMAVNRKLEHAAQHYTRIVTWQLQHNREQHELRLQRLRSFINLETATDSEQHTSGKNSHQTGSGQGSVMWIEKITQIVASEKVKLIKQRESAKVRLENAEKKLDTLKVLNASLCNNRVEWHRRLHAAKGNVQVYQNTVIKAANKVKILMQKLDSSTPATASATATAAAGSKDLEGKGGQGDGQGGQGGKQSQGATGTAHSSSSNIFDRQQSSNG